MSEPAGVPRADCPDCGLEDHPHQTCAEANMSDREVIDAMKKAEEANLNPGDRFSVSCWFVESVVNGKFDGWFAAPQFGYGGWLTNDPNAAKKYTEAEARAVAHALTYFHAPFNYSNWVATEHLFTGKVPDERTPDTAPEPEIETYCKEEGYQAWT